MNRNIFVIILLVSAISCGKSARENGLLSQPMEFDPGTLSKVMSPVNLSKGQLLYLPVYSNIPYQIDTTMFDMSAFVAIHNINPKSEINLTKVLYFNEEGKLVDDFLKGTELKISPLATKNFYIPYEDKSGTGANFLIEWVADSLVNSPLVESITLCLKPNNTVSIMSTGKIISESK